MFGIKIFESQKIVDPWLKVFDFGYTYFKPLFKKIGLLSILIRQLNHDTCSCSTRFVSVHYCNIPLRKGPVTRTPFIVKNIEIAKAIVFQFLIEERFSFSIVSRVQTLFHSCCFKRFVERAEFNHFLASILRFIDHNFCLLFCPLFHSIESSRTSHFFFFYSFII